MTRPVIWYAGCKDIVRMGPYASQVEAWKALRAAPGRYTQYNPRIGADVEVHVAHPVHVPGAYVWPEYAPSSEKDPPP